MQISERPQRVGIDLGTTNTVVCYYDADDNPCYLTFGPRREKFLSSVVFIDEANKKVEVGSKAVSRTEQDPRKVIRSSKTHMGDSSFYYPDASQGHDFTQKFSAMDIATYILKEVRNTLIKRGIFDGNREIEAVITVPARFKTQAIAETSKAGEKAGFKVVNILKEPVAAAFAYVEEHIPENTQLFVVDFGGGTLDLTFMKYVDESQNKIYDTIATKGNEHLGGDDIDKCVVKLFKEVIKEDLGIDLSSIETSGLSERDFYQAEYRLNREAIEAKIALSQFDAPGDENSPEAKVRVYIPELFSVNGKGIPFDYELKLKEFNQCCEPVFKEFVRCIDSLFSETKNVEITDTKMVLLVGGSCYIPKVREHIHNIFPDSEMRIADLSNAVALGAGIYINTGSVVRNKTVYDLGIAAENKDTHQLEFSTIVPRNTTIPANDFCNKYTTTRDFQKVVDVMVYERKPEVPEDDCDLSKCDYWGELKLTDFLTGRKGEPEIEVCFDYDTGGRLTVTVTDLRQAESKCGKRTVIEARSAPPKSARTQAQPLDIFLLIDASGSMTSVVAKNSNITRIEAVKNAVGTLVTELTDLSLQKIGIYSFGDTSRGIVSLTNDKSVLLAKSAGIRADGSATIVAGAINSAADALRKSRAEGRIPVIIILTDGLFHDKLAAASAAEKARKDNIRVITIGSGQLDFNLLASMASTRADGSPDMYKIENMNELRGTFGEIMDSLTQL